MKIKNITMWKSRYNFMQNFSLPNTPVSKQSNAPVTTETGGVKRKRELYILVQEKNVV